MMSKAFKSGDVQMKGNIDETALLLDYAIEAVEQQIERMKRNHAAAATVERLEELRREYEQMRESVIQQYINRDC